MIPFLTFINLGKISPQHEPRSLKMRQTCGINTKIRFDKIILS